MEAPVACAKPAPIRAPVAAAISSLVHKGAHSSLPLRNGRPDLVVVRERQGPVADDLARFMAFAGHDQDIARREAP